MTSPELGSRHLGKAAPAPRYLSFTTRCFARVYRHHGDPLDLIGHVDHGHVKGAPTIIAATTSKMLGAPSGSFTLTLRSPLTFKMDVEIRNGDWIVIWWQRSDRTFHGLLGNIDGVRRMRQVSGGATTIDFMVTGRDIGKVFETAEVWFNEYCEFGSNVAGKIVANRVDYVPGGSPDRVIENLLDAFLGEEMNVGGAWRWPRGLRERFGEFFAQALYLNVQGTKPSPTSARFLVGTNQRAGSSPSVGTSSPPLLRGELINENSLFQPQPGTKLHDILVRWSNPILNELFYDIHVEDDDDSPPDRPKPMVYLRERPFPNIIHGAMSPWFRLPTVKVRRSEVSSEDLGANDAERINLIMLYARSSTMTQHDQYAAYPPLIDLEDAQQYGLRRWERQIDFAGIGATGDGTSWGQEINTWLRLLASWYGLNHEWLNGSISFNFLLGEARPGYRLLIQGDAPEDQTQAYIEGVSHSWRFPTGATTTLSLSRGYIGSDEQMLETVSKKAAQFGLPREAPADFGVA